MNQMNRAELLREQAILRALSWKDSSITARLETLYRLLNRLHENTCSNLKPKG